MNATGVNASMFVTPFTLLNPLGLVRQLAVLTPVEAEHLVFFTHSETDGRVNNLQQDEGHHARVNPCNGDRRDLDEKLARIAVEETIHAGGIDSRSGKY